MDVTALGSACLQQDVSTTLLRRALDTATQQNAALLEGLDPAVGRTLDVTA